MKMNLQSVDDAKLVSAVKAGDHRAFEILVKRYQKQVASLIYSSFGNKDDVEDLTQEVFIRVYQSIHKYKYEGSFFAWLYRITMNLCVDEVRKRKIKKILSLDFLTEESLENFKISKEQYTPSDAVLKKEKEKIIRDAINHISPVYREAIVLREYHDLSYSEIAQVLGITVETVKTRIFRARTELRKILEDYFKESK